MICPECGAEYLSGVVTCPDCLVDLVTGETAAATVPDHTLVTFDLSTLSPDQLEALAWRLRVAKVRGEVSGSSLVVAREDQAKVEELRAELVAPLETIVGGGAEWTRRDTIEELPTFGAPAAVGTRVYAWFVDTVVTVLVSALTLNFVLERAGADAARDNGWLLLTLFVAMYRIVCVAVWGQTVGYRMAGIRVVARSDRTARSPGWRRSVIRVAVLVLPTSLPIGGLSGALGALVGLALGLWVPAALLAALTDNERRGLHDRLAGVVVINTTPG